MTRLTAPRTRFVSHSRRSAMGDVDARRAWLLFLTLARDQAQRAIDHAPASKDAATAFLACVVQLKAPFPVRMACADDAAAACLRLARGLSVAGRAEDAAELGAILLVGLGFLDRILTEWAIQHAAWARRVTGETD